MNAEDISKTTFITPMKTYSNTKMPFSLKNMGATFQRVVKKVYSKQIEKNIKF